MPEFWITPASPIHFEIVQTTGAINEPVAGALSTAIDLNYIYPNFATFENLVGANNGRPSENENIILSLIHI